MDTSPATIDCLPHIAKAVAGLPDIMSGFNSTGSGIQLILDSGVRRGSDIFKALALGATAVMVGRPILYGLAVSGEAGAEHILSILRQEFINTMKLCGCKKISDISRAHIAPTDWAKL